ncbi:MAG: hypothetical protein ACRDBG_16670 [Waterburya sp.]
MRHSVIIEAKSKHTTHSATFCILKDEGEVITDLWENIDRIAAGLAEILHFEIVFGVFQSLTKVYLRGKLIYDFRKKLDDRTYWQMVHEMLRNRQLIESFLKLNLVDGNV